MGTSQQQREASGPGWTRFALLVTAAFGIISGVAVVVLSLMGGQAPESP